MNEREEGRREGREEGKEKGRVGQSSKQVYLTAMHAALEGGHGSVVMVGAFVVTAIYCWALPGAMPCSWWLCIFQLFLSVCYQKFQNPEVYHEHRRVHKPFINLPKECQHVYNCTSKIKALFCLDFKRSLPSKQKTQSPSLMKCLLKDVLKKKKKDVLFSKNKGAKPKTTTKNVQHRLQSSCFQQSAWVELCSLNFWVPLFRHPSEVA